MSEEERTTIEERHKQHEYECKASAELSVETLNMLNYLTSDEVIRVPFLTDAILSRFVSLLLSVLQKIVGSKSLDIKVDNMHKYNFEPKVVLTEVSKSMVHFFDDEKFCAAVAEDSFYFEGIPLKKAIQTVSKFGLITPAELGQFRILAESVARKRESVIDSDTIVENAPPQYIDTMMASLMRDPVRLPTSGNILDRSTIEQCLLNDPIDPFNRQPLSADMLEPLLELKQEISEWFEAKLAEQKVVRASAAAAAAAAEAVATAATADVDADTSLDTSL